MKAGRGRSVNEVAQGTVVHISKTRHLGTCAADGLRRTRASTLALEPRFRHRFPQREIFKENARLGWNKRDLCSDPHRAEVLCLDSRVVNQYSALNAIAGINVAECGFVASVEGFPYVVYCTYLDDSYW